MLTEVEAKMFIQGHFADRICKEDNLERIARLGQNRDETTNRVHLFDLTWLNEMSLNVYLAHSQIGKFFVTYVTTKRPDSVCCYQFSFIKIDKELRSEIMDAKSNVSHLFRLPGNRTLAICDDKTWVTKLPWGGSWGGSTPFVVKSGVVINKQLIFLIGRNKYYIYNFTDDHPSIYEKVTTLEKSFGTGRELVWFFVPTDGTPTRITTDVTPERGTWMLAVIINNTFHSITEFSRAFTPNHRMRSARALWFCQVAELRVAIGFTNHVEIWEGEQHVATHGDLCLRKLERYFGGAIGLMANGDLVTFDLPSMQLTTTIAHKVKTFDAAHANYY